MKTLAINSIPTTAPTQKSKKTISFPVGRLMITLLLLAGLLYGIAQMDTVVNFYEALLAEIGQLEALLQDPNRLLR